LVFVGGLFGSLLPGHNLKYSNVGHIPQLTGWPARILFVPQITMIT
jgi:hypothetical protein